jgi:hypothetical protein
MAEPVDLRELKRWTGGIVELRFHNGYIARVLLIDVDPDSPPHELIYDVLEVLARGALDPAKVDRTAAHAAPAADLASWKLVS